MSHAEETTSKLLVCTLPSTEFAKRRIEVQGFVERASSVEATSTGLRFVFRNTNETAHALVDFILLEQKCCSAVSYELQSLPPHTDIILQLHASGELLASLQALYLDAHGQTGTQASANQNVAS